MDTYSYQKSFYRILSILLSLSLVLSVLPIWINAESKGEYCNGTDMYSIGLVEYFANTDDEDKLYKTDLSDGSVSLVLAEHIISMVFCDQLLYLLVYRDGDSVLMRFDPEDESSVDLVTISGVVSNIACRDQILYYITDGNIVSYYLTNKTSNVLIDTENVSLLYFADYNNMQYYTETDGKTVKNTYSFDKHGVEQQEEQRGSPMKTATSYTPRLTAPATDNPYYTTLNIFHQCGYGMAPNIGNCTCYAFGRSYENLGTEPKLSHGNAGGWYDYNRNNGYYSFGKNPALGAVAVWKSGGAGHVAVVEVIDGNTVTTSESGWQSFYFKTVTRSASNSNFSASSYYSFQGFIYVLGTSVETQPCETHTKGSFLWYQEVHPHYNYWKCSVCGETFSDGTTTYLKTCEECQTEHTAHTKGEFLWYQEAHPHYNYWACSVCGEYFTDGTITALDSCSECQRPAKPIIIDLKEEYTDSDQIKFEWSTDSHTTHSNFWLWREEEGNWTFVDKVDYAQSGLQRKLSAGTYRIQICATNSNYYEADGSTWLYCNSDYLFFTVNHTYADIVTAPTCTEKGYTTHTCTGCGDSYQDTYTAALGHNYSYKVTTTPTTSATGVLTGTCSRCSGTTTVTLPKLNTTDYNYSIVKAATCTATGTGRYTWKTTTYGSFYFDVTIAKTAHNYTTKVTAPTCTAQGYTTHTCTACGDSYKDTYTAALGHNYSYKVTTTPTTSATGALTGTCSRCSGTTTVTLPKLNTTDYSHSVVNAATCTATGTGRYTWKTTTYGSFYFDVTIAKTAHNYTTTVTAPTCTAQGYTTHTCTACGDSYKDTYTAALGHNYNYKVTTTPTTSATGALTGTCSRCSGTTTVTLPKLNTTDYSYSVVNSATCTATGTGRYTWKTTTYGSFYFDVTLAKTAHNYTATVTAPTCTAQGYTTHTCTACGDSYKDTYTAALGHNYSYKVTTTPTTSATGALTGTCSRCSGTTTVTLLKLNTTDYSYSVVKAATCTATGTGRYTWKTTTYGSFYFDVTLAKTAHNYTATVTAPTCTAQGYTTHTCTACGDSYKDTYTAALGHNYSYKVTTTPTTSATGVLTGTCSRCSGTTTVTLPKLNTTDYSYSVVKAATCTATGTGRYTWKTTTYGSYNFDVTIAKTAHNYTATVTAPTCTAQGYTTHTCTACGDSYKDTYIAALGHSESTWIVDHNATCTASGSKHTQCTRCGVVMQTATIAANGHTAGTWIIDKNATCTASGTKHTECTVCGATLETATIPAAGHSYTTSVTEPTCTAQGYTTHTCTVCGDSYKDTYTTELGHAWDNGAVTTQPTETTEGVKTFTCTRCGVTKTESIPALGHEHHYTDTVTEPTCTEKGYTTHTCECGDSYNDTYVDALGHAWDNGTVTTQPTETTEGVKTFTCTRCGITRTETIPTTGNKPCDGGADCPSGKFVDVNPKEWYHPYVDYAVEHGLFGGTSANTFEPETAMTRAMLVTVLWRYEGQPEAGENTFSDVPSGQWYTKAVAWAAANGVVNGVGNGKFDPEGKITREQMATILFRYAEKKGIDTSKRGDLSAFPDANKISAYAKEAIAWAVGEGIINGSDGKLLPQGSATRAQVATILMRFIENIVKK